ncbi:MAG: hypothetical protein U0269_18000 [Polyangiales bacterium]
MLHSSRATAFAALFAALSTACAPRVSNPDGALPDAGADGATTSAYGYFGVELVRIELAQPQVSLVRASLLSAEPAPTFPMRTTMREGECELRETAIPFCSPRCGSNAVCVAENTCAPVATPLPLGTITLTGLRRLDGAMSSTLVPEPDGMLAGIPTQQTIESDRLTYPPFEQGETVQWSIGASSALPALTMSLPAIDEMRVLSLDPMSGPNMPLEVRWEAPRSAVADGQRVIVSLDFTHHAGLRGMVYCETADDGAMTIPASVITGLHALGTAGWPALFVTRSIQRSMTVNGATLRFEHKSEKEIYVAISGLISCHEDSECPDGRRCQPNFTCAR